MRPGPSLPALLAALLSARVAGADQTLTLSGAVDSGGPDHVLLPFEVPAGTVEIEVEHTTVQPPDVAPDKKNILDWGLNDPAGFRGWGGGNSENAVVGEQAASRSYLRGPIPAGTWSVVVGKAKLLSPPFAYDIKVTLRTAPTLAPQTEKRPYAPAPALREGPGWYAGDLHVHSRESGDASPTLDEVATFARSQGLDFVELSDHNTTSQLELLGDAQSRHPDLLLLPGVEYTTYAGHANGIGATRFVDHKIGQPGVTIDGAARAFHDQSALLSINHPALDLGDLCIGCAWKHDLAADLIDAVEIETGGYKQSGFLFNEPAIVFWEKLLATGRHLPAVGGSDDHKSSLEQGAFGSPVANPTTMVYATELSAPAIVEGIRRGRTVVKLQSPADPMVELSAPGLDGDTVRADAPTLRATVTGLSGTVTARFVRNGERLPETPVEAEGAAVELPVQAPASGEDRYRVELLVDGKPRVVTSHLWVRKPDAAPAPDAGSDDGCSARSPAGGAWAAAAVALLLASLRRRTAR